MPPILRELKTRNTTQNKAWHSLDEALREKSEPEVEQEQFGENLALNKSNKRLKYQKASFHLRAKLVQMVDKEGLSIRQVNFLSSNILTEVKFVLGVKEARDEIFDSEMHLQTFC